MRPGRYGGIVVAQLSREDIAVSRDWTSAWLFPAIVNSSDDAIVGETLDGVIASWNPAAERMYGYAVAEIVGRPATVLCPPGGEDEGQEILARIGRGEHVPHYETFRRRKDGTDFSASVTVSPIRDETGRLIGASSITQDVTEQMHARAAAEVLRRAEDLKVANGSLESFTYSVSHDLRAPLRAMSGFSAALLEEYGDVLGDDGRGYAGRIVAASEHMAALIDNLLRLSRLSRAEMHLDSIDLGAEAAQIAAELADADPGRHVRFTIQRPVPVQADRALIRILMHNLLSNAWKFTSRRDDALIEFGTTPAVDGPVCYWVRDDGAGFDPAYTDKLFSPFQRLHPASEFPGTGIGLAIVRLIAERHGGRVWAEGAVDAGATFYFTLAEEESA
jgi:PAS domain S-box-containing protein